MDSGQIFRSVVKNVWQLSLAIFATAIILVAGNYLMPKFYGPLIVTITEVFLIIGITGLYLGSFFVFQIYHATMKSLSEIDKVIDEIGSKESIWSSVQPPYLLADSIDRELLAIIKETGGEILGIEDRIFAEALVVNHAEVYNRLGRLHLRGLIIVSREHKRITLTTLGMEALNTPAVLFVSKIPQKIWDYVFKQKIALSQEKWGIAVAETAKTIEAVMKEKVTEMKNNDQSAWDEIKKGLPKKEISEWTAGSLLDGLIRGGIVEKNGFEYFLIHELKELRDLIHDKEKNYPFGPSDGDKCDIYLNLLLRLWYGFR